MAGMARAVVLDAQHDRGERGGQGRLQPGGAGFPNRRRMGGWQMGEWHIGLHGAHIGQSPLVAKPPVANSPARRT
jgi:hypothetical protein